MRSLFYAEPEIVTLDGEVTVLRLTRCKVRNIPERPKGNHSVTVHQSFLPNPVESRHYSVTFESESSEG